MESIRERSRQKSARYDVHHHWCIHRRSRIKIGWTVYGRRKDIISGTGVKCDFQSVANTHSHPSCRAILRPES